MPLDEGKPFNFDKIGGGKIKKRKTQHKKRKTQKRKSKRITRK